MKSKYNYNKIKRQIKKTLDNDEINYKLNLLNHQEKKYFDKIKYYDNKIKLIFEKDSNYKGNLMNIVKPKKKFLVNTNKIFANKSKYVKDIINRKEILKTDIKDDKENEKTNVDNFISNKDIVNKKSENEINEKSFQSNKKRLNPKIESYYNSKLLREGKIFANINNEMVIFDLNEKEFDIDIQIN